MNLKSCHTEEKLNKNNNKWKALKHFAKFNGIKDCSSYIYCNLLLKKKKINKWTENYKKKKQN